MASDTLTYAYLGTDRNELVYIDDPRVKNGEACECYCPACGQRLRGAWNQGKKQTHHFKHLGKDCEKGQMTALHKMAQDIILQNRKIMSPEFNGYYSELPHELCFDSIELERTEIVAAAKRRPDCIGWINGIKYWIEILVTHKVDDEKVEQIAHEGINCVEIDLHDLKDQPYLPSELQNRLETCSCDRVWIYNNDLYQKDLELKQQAELERKQREEEERKRREEYEARQKELEESEREVVKTNLEEMLLSLFASHQLRVNTGNTEICDNTSCPLFDNNQCRQDKIANLSELYDVCKKVERPGSRHSLELLNSKIPQRTHLFIEIYARNDRQPAPSGSEKVIQIKAYKKDCCPKENAPIEDYKDQNIYVRKFNFKSQPPSAASITELPSLYSFLVYPDGRSVIKHIGCQMIQEKLQQPAVFEVRLNGPYNQDEFELKGAAIASRSGIDLRNCWICENCFKGICHCNGYQGTVAGDSNHAIRCANFRIAWDVRAPSDRQLNYLKIYIPQC